MDSRCCPQRQGQLSELSHLAATWFWIENPEKHVYRFQKRYEPKLQIYILKAFLHFYGAFLYCLEFSGLVFKKRLETPACHGGNALKGTGEEREMELEHFDSSLRTRFLLQAARGVRTAAVLAWSARPSLSGCRKESSRPGLQESVAAPEGQAPVEWICFEKREQGISLYLSRRPWSCSSYLESLPPGPNLLRPDAAGVLVLIQARSWVKDNCLLDVTAAQDADLWGPVCIYNKLIWCGVCLCVWPFFP